MGAWGSGIFENDDAVDAREELKTLIGQKIAPEQACQTVIDQFCLEPAESPDNNHVILSLASTLQDLGISEDSIKMRALGIIYSTQEIERWGTLAASRKDHLEALRKKLTSPLPPPKVIRKRKFKENPHQIGEHLVFTDKETGSKLLLRVVGEREDSLGKYPRFTVLDWDGTDSSLEHPALLSPLRGNGSYFAHRIYVGALIIGGRVKKENLVKLPERAVVLSDREYGGHFMTWPELLEHVTDSAVNVPLTVRS